MPVLEKATTETDGRYTTSKKHSSRERRGEREGEREKNKNQMFY